MRQKKEGADVMKHFLAIFDYFCATMFAFFLKTKVKIKFSALIAII
jgi:hypothetical protein